MEKQTDIFRIPVRDGMREAPPSAKASEPLSTVIVKMNAEGSSGIVVTDDGGRPLGIVTEYDITHRAAFQLPETTPAAEIMTEPVHCISADEYLYHAIALMRRQKRRHMPVVDALGVLTGMLNLHDTLGAVSKSLMDQLDKLTREDGVDGLTEIKSAQIDLAHELFQEDVPAVEIQALLNHINLDIYRRVTSLSLKAIAEEGLGPPPAEFSVIVMGSGGRGESFLFPDQDNGFIIDDYPDEDHTAIDAWFIDLAERLTQAMDRIGLPLCKGFVMATNPLWRKTISQWQDQVTLWSRKRNSVVLRHCDIFFDFKAAFTTSERGQEMTDALRRHVTETARDNKVFLGQLYAIDQDQRPALGWFRRFRTMRESDPPGYKGYLNLKHSGTLPLVEGMRLLCLREGLVINPTLDRLQALHEGGVLRDDEADYLAGGYRHISHLLMRQQIRDFKAGRNVTNFIHPGSLTKREKDILKDSFEAISALQDRLRLELTGNVF